MTTIAAEAKPPIADSRSRAMPLYQMFMLALCVLALAGIVVQNAFRQDPEIEAIFDVADFRSADKARILSDIHAMTERRFTVARELLRRGQPDFFMMVEMGSDRVHHGFWHMMDESHRRHEPGHPLAGAIHD